MTQKLVYESTKVSVKLNDKIDIPSLGGIVTVKGVHAPRKKAGMGKVTLLLPDGRKLQYSISVIRAVWI